MRSKQKKKDEVRKEISKILMSEWDPIGVKHVEGALDEYDDWSKKIQQLISEGADTNKIAHHLAKLQSGILAKDVNPEKLIPIAKKLLEILD